MKEKELLSTGLSPIYQGFYILLFLVFNWVLGITIFQPELNFIAIIIFAIAVVCEVILMRVLFSFADVYVASNQVIIKNIIGNRSYLLSDIKSVNETLYLWIYYLKFDNGRKVYFRLNNSYFFKRFNTWGNEIVIKDLKKKLGLE